MYIPTTGDHITTVVSERDRADQAEAALGQAEARIRQLEAQLRNRPNP